MHRFGLLFLLLVFGASPGIAADFGELSARYTKTILPLLDRYCLDCHDAETQKGELDLARFDRLEALRKEPKIWQHVRYQLENKEMPPAKKPQLEPTEKEQLLSWVTDYLRAESLANAGDPGPVVLRRLSNAEYTYTLQDLTGLSSLNPAAEFPVDGAAGEGFSNTGAALVMSPALLDKYLAAAKQVAQHAVLLPDGIGWSESISPSDWSEERLTAIRALYARYAEPGGSEAHDLQGVRFTTKAAGVIPLEAYFRATIVSRDVLAEGGFAEVAAREKLSVSYLKTLFDLLRSEQASILLDPIRARWRTATPEDARALAKSIAGWQAALWSFGKVGHIGKRDGPTAWQMPVMPLQASREVSLEFGKEAKAATLYLTLGDAGDGATDDRAIWKDARLVLPDRPAVPLAQLGANMKQAEAARDAFVEKLPEYLKTLAGSHQTKKPLEELAVAGEQDLVLLQKLAAMLQLGHSELPVPEGHYVEKTKNAGGKPSLHSWHAPGGLPSIAVNTSDETVSTSTPDFPPRSVVMHPMPTIDALLYWRSPVDTRIVVTGRVADADDACGNGAAWRVDLLSRSGVTMLAEGVYDKGKSVNFGPTPELAVRAGDLLRFTLSARDQSHVCDSTHLELTIREIQGEKRVWDVADELIDRLLDGNPLADRFGHPAVWHFAQGAEDGAKPKSKLPAGSTLAEWRDAVNQGAEDAALTRLAVTLQTRLSNGEEAPLNERFLNWHWNVGVAGGASEVIEQVAPSVLSFHVPASLAAGARFVAQVVLHPEAGAKASVQPSASLNKPSSLGLEAAPVQPGKDGPSWSFASAPAEASKPILVQAGSVAETRLRGDIEAFQEVFPAALCYTKIVPTDEVVTLRLYHREDEALRRLMLSPAEKIEIARLWSELHFVSHDKLKLVDVFDQLWQYATQDSDPSVLEPLRKPIRDDAAAFRQRLLRAEPVHVDAVFYLANKAWRRSLSEAEWEGLRTLYKQLRGQDIDHSTAIRLLLARVFSAPAFLYKTEQPSPKTGPVGDRELATRLSYFLWSSVPDEVLRGQVRAGLFRLPGAVTYQAQRMLQDTKIERLGLEFGCQWLGIRNFDSLDEKNERLFPEFAALRGPMRDEAQQFFTALFRDNRSILSLLDADHGFLDPTLASFYGLGKPGADGRVSGLREQGRGGILGMAATLARQSGASRSSPILRGNWIHETLLGQHLPKPPADVPQLPDAVPEGLTERQLIERHSSEPACAKCHAKIDPYGFALERFDAIGRSREDGRSLDARLPDGQTIAGLAGLRSYLLADRRDDFVRQFCRKLLGYALGRSVQLSDEPLLDEMMAALEADDFKVWIAVEQIVNSPQFNQIRGVTE